MQQIQNNLLLYIAHTVNPDILLKCFNITSLQEQKVTGLFVMFASDLLNIILKG